MISRAIREEQDPMKSLPPSSSSSYSIQTNTISPSTIIPPNLSFLFLTSRILPHTISASGSKIEPEDVMLHILNGLPSTYNSFKSTIRNSLILIDLDTFYALLCNEEIHLHQESLQEQPSNASPATIYAAPSNSSRTRNGNNRRYTKHKTSFPTQTVPVPQLNSSVPQQQWPTCQICGKLGHITLNCWHRNNPNQGSDTVSTANGNASSSHLQLRSRPSSLTGHGFTHGTIIHCFMDNFIMGSTIFAQLLFLRMQLLRPPHLPLGTGTLALFIRIRIPTMFFLGYFLKFNLYLILSFVILVTGPRATN
ncbi:uncharacterized protein LOC114579782 [Dendrobium catenatum]|uniref:uncharacterized protein LOC114579782 n=1 Tax=Dendrobium catenatum TaxID=906689 RepID=UPI00109EE409|nr:uncharacterized protein LOC114579782 [Dendrobium catenatum]